MLFELGVSAFVIYFILHTMSKYKHHRISFLQMFVWILFWVLVLLVLIFPEVLNEMADFVGIGRGVDVVIYLSLLVLFFIIFKQSIKMRHLSSQLVKMTSEYAKSHPKKRK